MPELLLCQLCGTSFNLYPCQTEGCAYLNCATCYQHELNQCFSCSQEYTFFLTFQECLQAFFDLNINIIHDFKHAASKKRLEEFNQKFLETSHFDFPRTAKINLEFLNIFVEKKLYQVVPWDFVFCYILHCEKNSSSSPSNECLLWYLKQGFIWQSTIQYFDQSTQEQCLLFFQNLDYWYENLKGSSPSKTLLDFLEKWKKGVQHFKCQKNKDFAQMFAHMLVLLKTRFWGEENSFVCCIGIICAESDLFSQEKLSQVGSFYSNKRKSSSISSSSVVVPPCPKKTPTYCQDCNKRTARKCQTCRRAFCSSCSRNNACQSCHVHHIDINININNNNIDQTVE